jgi:hypothetical protein
MPWDAPPERAGDGWPIGLSAPPLEPGRQPVLVTAVQIA